MHIFLGNGFNTLMSFIEQQITITSYFKVSRMHFCNTAKITQIDPQRFAVSRFPLGRFSFRRFSLRRFPFRRFPFRRFPLRRIAAVWLSCSAQVIRCVIRRIGTKDTANRHNTRVFKPATTPVGSFKDTAKRETAKRYPIVARGRYTSSR